MSELEAIVKEFVDTHEISCAESIYQTDSVIENSGQLIEKLIDIVGYFDIDQ